MMSCSVHMNMIALASIFVFIACNNHVKDNTPVTNDSSEVNPVFPAAVNSAHNETTWNDITPDSLVSFARTLKGVPYLYASTDPAKGFDCSGFITYVFNHFNIQVPRSSVDFTNYGRDVSLQQTRPGDLILFTGTDTAVRVVGHMGIVEYVSADTLRFIHSSSGKGLGVVITTFGDYYRKRFVKVIRVFPDEFFPD